MKTILLSICAVTLLGATGCVIWDGHDRGRDRDHWQRYDSDRYSTGVDHSEHPGDLDHQERR